MEIKLGSLCVPDHLTQVLSCDVQDTRKSYAKVVKILQTSEHLKILIKKYFSAYQSKQNIEDILNYTGWALFRTRLIGIYLEYIRDGRFPKNPDPNITDDAEQFCRVLDRFCVNGYSRHYLLYFYIKGLELSKPNLKKFELLDSVKSTHCILETSKFKHIKIDWLVLLVWHLKEFWNEEKLLSLIKKYNGDLQPILSELTDSEKELLVSNLLSYGHSINDQEFFLFEKV